MKFISSLIIPTICILFFWGCNTGSTDLTIGFLMPDGEGSRWPTDLQYLQDAAGRHNATVISKNADNDENQQIKHASELLETGVDILIVVSVNANTAAAIVREAHSYNVPVIAYDRLIKNSDLDYYITFEGAQIAKLMVDHAIAKVPRGNYVMLWGDPGDVNAISIMNAQNEFLQPHINSGAVNVVYKSFVDNWAADNAYHIMSRVLSMTDQKIDVVLTSYDGLAIGALRAIKEHPEHDIKVLTGQDAEIEALKALLNDELSLTVYKSIKTLASSAMDLAVKLVNNENITESKATINNGRKEVPTIMLQPQAVDKSSIRSTVIADGYYTEEQVFGN
ncbi:MAG: substrate-binding domain-containing protein [Prolixibacteraceae bacterium]|jgi:D-xylose transport system substrate-binding protein|nr:substrate-binding domain-containing protein [Prolixibacteraceae bacterium]